MDIPVWSNLGHTKRKWIIFGVGIAVGLFAHRLLA